MKNIESRRIEYLNRLSVNQDSKPMGSGQITTINVDNKKARKGRDPYS